MALTGGPRTTDLQVCKQKGKKTPSQSKIVHSENRFQPQFHANEELQDLCDTVDANARRYLILVQDDKQDQKYKSVIAIPSGTLLAVY